MEGLKTNEGIDFGKIVEELLLKIEDFDLTIFEIKMAGPSIQEGINNLMKGMKKSGKGNFLTIEGGGSIAYSPRSNTFEIKISANDDEGFSGTIDSLGNTIRKLATNLEGGNTYASNIEKVNYTKNRSEGINDYLKKGIGIIRSSLKGGTFTQKWNAKNRR